MGLCFSSWGSRVADIQRKMDVGEGALGLIFLAIPCGLGLSLVIAGWLTNRLGSQRLLSIACLGYALMLPMLGLAPNIALLVLALFIFGFVGNLGNIAVNTRAVSVERMFGQTIMSSFHGIWSLAGLVGANVGSLMIKFHVDPLYHFLFVAGAGVLLWATNASSTLPPEAPVSGKQPIFVKPDKSLLGLGVIAFCCMISEGTMYDWSTVYFAKTIQSAPEQVALGFSAFTVATTTGRFTGDWLSRRIGIMGILSLSGIITASGLLLSAIFPTVMMGIIGFFLVGLGVSAVVPLLYSEAGRSKTMSPSMAIAAVSSIGFPGFLLGPRLSVLSPMHLAFGFPSG
ncbi:MFS transporter [Chitinophaga sedimenti]|uniref:MFS transporter n=1 Tax=Chitinophaga sedimenti TaxID=2033606 RepID=UPI002003DB5C|nr:MFS transporter [Chitinophaga sedimenti]MCK7559963.1 MFS transporter [Chitinophaga sedimenti]